MIHWLHNWNYHRKHLRTCRICHRHEEFRQYGQDGYWVRLTCKEYNIAIDLWVKWEKVHNYDVADDCKYPGAREIPPKPWPIVIDSNSNVYPHPIEERPTTIAGRKIKEES